MTIDLTPKELFYLREGLESLMRVHQKMIDGNKWNKPSYFDALETYEKLNNAVKVEQAKNRLSKLNAEKPP